MTLKKLDKNASPLVHRISHKSSEPRHPVFTHTYKQDCWLNEIQCSLDLDKEFLFRLMCHKDISA